MYTGVSILSSVDCGKLIGDFGENPLLSSEFLCLTQLFLGLSLSKKSLMGSSIFSFLTSSKKL